MSESPFEHRLKGFGYSPGKFVVRCKDCRALNEMVEKGSERCFDCALKAWQAHQAPAPAERQEMIVAAACQWEGLTFSLPKPARHGQVLHSMEAAHMPDYALSGCCQGFLTSEGRFVNRVQGRQIAWIADQKPKSTGGDRDLYSEDLW